MSSTRQIGQLTRLFALLAVLLGLLAMHGLASTHHAAAAVPMPPAVAHADGPATDVATGHADQVSATGDAASPAFAHRTDGAGSALPSPDCHGDCRPDAAVLCLAVLVAASAAALLAAAARRRAGPHRPARLSTARPPAPRLPAPATPDSVKDLCVCRT